MVGSSRYSFQLVDGGGETTAIIRRSELGQVFYKSIVTTITSSDTLRRSVDEMLSPRLTSGLYLREFI